nr:hypothetical protein [Tanacetum cinerariifolium]
VIEFGDSYEVPASTASTTTTETTSGETGKKSGRTVILTAEDMQKRKNDVKARTTLLISLPDEHQLRFSYQEDKKNLLKQQYENFKEEGSKTLEQTFNRLQVIVGQLQFMDVKIEQDDLNQKAAKSRDRGRRDNYRQGSKVKEQAPKALMAIDGVGWDWSYMANDEEDHALVADEEAPTEFALM